MPTESPLILLAGATGYVGGRLLAQLEGEGRRLRCLARRPAFLRARVAPSTEVVQGDVLDPASLRPAMAGVHTAFYLVHSMSSGPAFEQTDRLAAVNFSTAAREAGAALTRRGFFLASERLKHRPPTTKAAAQTTVLIVEDDPDQAALADLRARGVRIEEYVAPDPATVDGIADMGHSWAAWFIDPSGNVLAVVQPKG